MLRKKVSKRKLQAPKTFFHEIFITHFRKGRKTFADLYISLIVKVQLLLSKLVVQKIVYSISLGIFGSDSIF